MVYNFRPGDRDQMFTLNAVEKIDLKPFLLILLFWVGGCQPPGEQHFVTLTIENELPISRQHLPIRTTLDELKAVAPDFTFDAFAIALGDPTNRQNPPQRISYQADDLSYDGKKDELVFLVDLQPNETEEAIVQYVPTKEPKTATDPVAIELIFERKTRAGIFPSLPASAAMESNLSLYLLYPNGMVEAFDKTTSGLYLQQLAQKESVAELIKVEHSQALFGTGGFAIWDKETQSFISIDSATDYVRVLVNGGIRSVVERILPKVNINKDVTISVKYRAIVYADNALLEQRVEISGGAGRFAVAVGLPNGEVNDQYLFRWQAKALSICIFSRSDNKKFDDSTLLLDSTAEWQTYIFKPEEDQITSLADFQELMKVTNSVLKSPPIITLSIPEKKKQRSTPQPPAEKESGEKERR